MIGKECGRQVCWRLLPGRLTLHSRIDGNNTVLHCSCNRGTHRVRRASPHARMSARGTLRTILGGRRWYVQTGSRKPQTRRNRRKSRCGRPRFGNGNEGPRFVHSKRKESYLLAKDQTCRRSDSSPGSRSAGMTRWHCWLDWLSPAKTDSRMMLKEETSYVSAAALIKALSSDSST